MSMSFDQIREALPQAYPFILVDRVESITANKEIVAIKNVSGNEWMFPGHFPGQAIYPGVLLVEGMAQASILLLRASRPHVSGRFLLGALRVQWLSPVVPGDQLRVICRVLKLQDDAAFVEATADVGDRAAARATLTFAVR